MNTLSSNVKPVDRMEYFSNGGSNSMSRATEAAVQGRASELQDKKSRRFPKGGEEMMEQLQETLKDNDNFGITC